MAGLDVANLAETARTLEKNEPKLGSKAHHRWRRDRSKAVRQLSFASDNALEQQLGGFPALLDDVRTQRRLRMGLV